MKTEDLYIAGAGFLIAAALLATVPAHAHTENVLHVMVYNVLTVQPTQHIAIRMADGKTCAAELPKWDALHSANGDRTEARCLILSNLGDIE